MSKKPPLLTPEQQEVLRYGRTLGQAFITDADFTDEYNKAVKIAKEAFERDGYHTHMILATLRDNKTKKMTMVPAMFADWPPPEGKKEQALMGLGVKIAEGCPDHTLVTVAHISEGYMANQDKLRASGKKFINDMDDADRMEVLTVSLTTQDLRQSYCSFEIQRNPDNTFKQWGDKLPLEKLYDPESNVHPLSEGDFVAHSVIKGYILARSKEQSKA